MTDSTRPTGRRWKQTWVLLVWLLSTTPALAHDVWVLPSTFQAEVGGLVRVDLRVGHRGAVETLARNDQRLVSLDAIAPDGEAIALPGLHGRQPAGVWRPQQSGWFRLVYQGNAAYSELSAERFEAYLREHGFEAAIEQRRAEGATDRAGREHYSRSLKALVWVAGDDEPSSSQPRDTAVGLPLEFVLQSAAPWVATESGAPDSEPRAVELLLLRDGAPLAGTQVRAYRLPLEVGQEVLDHTSDNGRVQLRLMPGIWMVAAVDLRRSTADNVDWESTWTAVTFELP